MSSEHLARPDLLVHAVRFIGQPLLIRGLARIDGPLAARIRTPGADDLVVDVTPGQDPRLELGDPSGPAAIECDGAARLLLLWGRKAQPFDRLRVGDDPAAVAGLQRLLAGY